MKLSKITHKDEAFGRRLKRLRNKAKLTQEQLADKTNLSQTFIGLIEVGRNKPSFKTLQKLATALKVKVNELFPF